MINTIGDFFEKYSLDRKTVGNMAHWWYEISKETDLSIDFIIKNNKKINWDLLFFYNVFNEEELNILKKYTTWQNISYTQKLTVSFIEKNITNTEYKYVGLYNNPMCPKEFYENSPYFIDGYPYPVSLIISYNYLFNTSICMQKIEDIMTLCKKYNMLISLDISSGELVEGMAVSNKLAILKSKVCYDPEEYLIDRKNDQFARI